MARRKKPEGWKGEPRRHAEAARKGKRERDERGHEAARQRYKNASPYEKHLIDSMGAVSFTPLSQEEFERRRTVARGALAFVEGHEIPEETPDERDFRRGEVRREYAEPLKFIEPVNRLHRLAKKYLPGISKEKVLFMAKRNPASFFVDLTGEMPLDSRTRKVSDKMAKLALEIDLGRKP